MNWVDYVILATLVLSTLAGVIRGITREVLGLGTWILAFVIAFLVAPPVAGWLQRWVEDPALRLLLGYGGVFLMTLALGAIVPSILASWIRGSHLSGADRSLGGGFGLLRAVLMIGAAALLSDLAEAREARWWTESQLIDKFDAVGDAIGALLPESWLDALRPEAVSGAQMEN